METCRDMNHLEVALMQSIMDSATLSKTCSVNLKNESFHLKEKRLNLKLCLFL